MTLALLSIILFSTHMSSRYCFCLVFAVAVLSSSCPIMSSNCNCTMKLVAILWTTRYLYRSILVAELLRCTRTRLYNGRDVIVDDRMWNHLRKTRQYKKDDQTNVQAR